MEAPEQFPVFFEVPPDVDAEQRRRIRNYFQIRRRSGGGECGSVTHIGDNVHCVLFKEREAQQRVLQRGEHVLEFAGGSLVLTVRDSAEPQGSAPIAASNHGPPSSQKQSIPASIPPPSGEECELRPDTYLLRYLKECPQAGRELERELASMDCTAQLFPEEGRLIVRRSAQPGAGDESRSLKAEVDKLLLGYRCHFEFDPPKVKALLQSSSSRQTADDVREYPEIGMVVVVGKHSQVNARLMDIEELMVQCRKSRSGEKQTSIHRFSEAKLRLLWREIEESLGQRFPELKVTRRDAGQVALEGFLKDVVEAGDWISDKENLVLERRVSNMSPHLLAFVGKAYGDPGALRDFLGVGDKVEIELRDTELRFLSLSPDKLDDPANKMQEKFKEIKIDLPNSSAVPSELREKLKSKTAEMNQGQQRAQSVFYADSTVCLLGHTKEVEELNETVIQYILDQSSIEGKVNLRFPELVQLLPELLQLHSFDFSGVRLHTFTSASGPMVALEGPSGKVTEVRNRLGPFLNSLVQGRVPINLPGALRYFESPSGRENILRVAHSQKCLIQLQVQPHMRLNLESGARLSDGVTIVASHNICDGLQVVVCHGDITKVVADALVNAANADLEHSGGVAAALSKAGGPEVQRESKTIVKQIGEVPTGDVVVTTGGNLQCKKLLHAVGPVFGKVGGRERSLLEQTVQSALNMAERMELRSVAIPCISSGIFGVPVNVCSEAIVTAVKEFCTQGGRSLSTVILIDNRAEVVRALQEACDRLFQGISTGNSPPRDLRFQTDAAGGDTTRGATAGAPGDNVHVEIVQGTIETQQVDGLVSPMVGHDPLSTRIGNSLLNVVGPQLTTRFSQNAGGAMIPGAIVLVEGLSAPGCKAVIFLNLLPWDNNQNGTAVQVLRQGIRKVLASCEDKGFHSVALPVLGTGVLLRFPHSVASRTLLEEVLVFQQSRASRSAFLVRVVIHPGDKESSKAFQSAQETVHVRGFRNDSNPDQASFYRKVSGTNNEVTAMLGGVKLQMVLGDIVTGGTDVIVNTTDFKTHSGVSRALLSAAGPQVQAQLAQVGIPADYMCTTGPGLLGCREIIHASFRSDPEVIQKNCKKILKQCESKGYSSVSFPAINTGVAGMDSVRACKAMLDGMAAAVRDMTLTSLSLIRVVILQQPVFHVFRSELESRFGKPAPSRLTLREKAKQILKKMREKGSRALSSSAPQGKTISSKPQPAVLSVICCGPDIIDAIERDLEGPLQKQLIEREVKRHDFSSLDDMELEAVLAKVRGFGISLELRSHQSSESARSGVTTRAEARNRSAAAEEIYVLRGLKEDVLSTTELINRAIHEALYKDLQDKKEAMLAYNVQWLIQDAEEGWQELSLHENFLLEDAHVNKQVCAEVTARDATVLRVNLRALEATNWQTGQTFKVKRSETGTTLELPTNWEPMDEEVFKKVELNPNSQEYQVVAQGFLKTAKYNIRKIERVQNLYLWQAFSVCRQRIFFKNGREEEQLGEKSLYHGTSAESCNCIEKDRFDRNYAGTHAAVRGKGVYFAVNAEYSAKNFSPRDTSGLGRLYVARVLTGRYTVGKAEMKAPPPRGTDPTDCFDSLVDKLQSPAMFVVFHDDQAYPEYLITFT
ncbi:protein mono-ADP-ribosyltransferase PARP14-like isoform X2 [Hippoglossus stenolepis]|uniref:protein mono-ADP-ribosyltransferase PARP14-like isoform X2 n=1 Tax=Hippoglossus stenolepis TaxID=195615 RepID=UPI001FAEAED2|nr:protein mono-ADP-ribosyltransferase PARP14-like isoform X2 [Hippoglossus stenolepis]